jgi:magnesium transporter
MSFRFRDVYDQLVRIADDALIFQDRISGILEAHLSSVSNRLNAVMKVLTVVSVIIMPLTLLAGLYGMNVPLPHLPGGETMQFWWICGICLAVSAGMLALFRRKHWI